ncbi:MAG: hypothetical protein WBM39_08885 [Parasphingorhabdus sp.]
MIKESILFVAATGVLIYFVTPSDDPVETGAVSEDAQKPVTRAPQTSDDGWGYEDEEEEEESFVFGEPINDAADDDDDNSSDEEDDSERREQAESRETAPKPVSRSRQKSSANSPQPNEQGGVNNPIIFATKNPSNPVDD